MNDWSGAIWFFPDQGLEVGLKSWAIFGRVAQQDFDQATFARTEMPLNPPAGEAMQEGDWLLSQKLFEFFGGHIPQVMGDA